MSVDYYMACLPCQECIQVASDGLSGFGFYSREPDCMAKLGDFLRDHVLCGGTIQFLNEYKTEDMKEREWRRAQRQVSESTK